MMDASSGARKGSLEESTSSKRVSRRLKRRSSRIDEESEILSFGNEAEEILECEPQPEQPNDDDDDEPVDELANSTANRSAIRRSSSSFRNTTTGSNNNNTRRPKLPDPHPRRLTNPLIDDSKVTTMQDLLRLTDEISFHQPDTYSISYHARVLGLKHLLDEISDNDVVGVPQLLERLKTPSNGPDTDGIYQIPERQVATRVFAPDDDAQMYDPKWDPVYHKLLRHKVIQTVPMTEPQVQKCLKIVNGVNQNAMAIRNEIMQQFDIGDGRTSTIAPEWLINKTYIPFEMAPFDVENASSTPSGWIAVDSSQNRIADAMLFQLEWFGTNPGVPILRWLVTSANPVLNSLVWQQAKMADIYYTISSVDVTPAFRATRAASGNYIGDFRKTSPTLIRIFRPETKNVSNHLRRRWIVRLPQPAELEGQGKHPVGIPRVFTNTQRLAPTAQVRLRVNVETGTIEGPSIDNNNNNNNNNYTTKLPVRLPPLHVLRDFTLPDMEPIPDDEVKQELIKAQNELRELEGNTIEPIARAILTKIVQDRVAFDDPSFEARKAEEAEIMEQTKVVIEQRKKSAKVMEEQISMDMEAVCQICVDGDITPDNQIIFCESCNVAVHQMCYGIEKIPSGDFYCVACRNLGRDKMTTHEPLSIRCELCPLPGGAFVKTAMPGPEVRWVHVVCAKWNGLEYVDREKWESVEDVTQMKVNFRRLHIRCELCLGERGAMIKCTGMGQCRKWFHVTCARALGKMRVTHGEHCHGSIGEGGWTLSCPLHTKVEVEQKNIIPVETMIKYANELPPEPSPPPEPRPFNLLNGADRNAVLADPKYENALMTELLQKRFYGVRCEICDGLEEEKQTRCSVCWAVFCSSCRMESDDVKKGNYFKCVSCRRVEALTKEGVQDFDKPRCCVCVQSGGPLRPAFAKPRARLEYWERNERERMRSYFGKESWTHTACAFWLPSLEISIATGQVDLSNSILNDGRGMVTSNNQCFACGITIGVKAKCSVEGCCVADNGKNMTTFHITCARQAGLEVSATDGDGANAFIVHCYRHCGNEYNLRAKLEDMLEIEKRRVGKDLAKSDLPMSFADGSRILNSAIYVMRVLGWAWRWAEWWVDHNSSWEPLLEPGQKEEDMTKEELKIVESTRKERCDDARRCRLAAFGAALRNREYDTGDDFKREALDQALRAVLHTKTLVGPMTPKEIDFFVEWLSRAYRSKSRLLYMGSDKSKVSLKSPFCFHAADHTPKYELGRRPLPGANPCVDDGVFEAHVDEPDNFMLLEDKALEHRNSSRKTSGGRPSQNLTTDKSLRTKRKPSPEKARADSVAPRKGGRQPRSSTVAEAVIETPKRSKGGSKKRATLSRSPSPKPPNEDYLTRNFKARSERRATYEARTSVVAKEPAAAREPTTVASPPKRRGRPPKRKIEDLAPEAQTGADKMTGTPTPTPTRESKRKHTKLKKEPKMDLKSVTEVEALAPSAASIEVDKGAEGDANESDEVSAAEDDDDDDDVSKFSEELPEDSTSFSAIKGRKRRPTRPLKLDGTSGKTHDANESEEEFSPPSKRVGARRKTG